MLNPECYPQAIFGCRYPNAINYNPNATVDDGSCVFFTKSFDIGLRATHYQTCIDTDNPNLLQVGFILHIDSITPNYPVVALNTFIEFYAYTDTGQNNVRRGCSAINPEYVQNPLFVNGVFDRRQFNRKTLIDLSGESPKYSQVFTASQDSITTSVRQDTDIVDGLSGGVENPLNLDIKIVADGEVFTRNVTISIIAYNSAVSTPYEIITIN
jgi:hypothetical protein